MFRLKILFWFLIFNILITSNFDAFARAGGRSSFVGGRSSTSFYNQGSRGSKTYQGGNYGNKNYAPINRSATDPKNNSAYRNNNSQNNQYNQQNNSSFFQRNPFMSAIGGALLGSWIGHMIFGGMNGMTGYGAGMGSSIINLLLVLLAIGGIIFWIRSTNRRSVAGVSNNFASQNFGYNNFNQPYSEPAYSSPSYNQNVDIQLPQSDQQKFAQMLIEVQKAWSNQDLEALRKLTTMEMYKYFNEALNQNLSQGLANKIEDIKVITVDLSEAWREEDGSEYATIIFEWMAVDYTYNINKRVGENGYITDGNDSVQTKSSEAWTFMRFGENGRWILSAIQQIS